MSNLNASDLPSNDSELSSRELAGAPTCDAERERGANRQVARVDDSQQEPEGAARDCGVSTAAGTTF